MLCKKNECDLHCKKLSTRPKLVMQCRLHCLPTAALIHSYLCRYGTCFAQQVPLHMLKYICICIYTYLGVICCIKSVVLYTYTDK